MNDVRVETDASVMNDKTGFGYVIYVNRDAEYEKVKQESDAVEKVFDSHQAEELAVIRGLWEAVDYYSGGTVAILTDSKTIVERIMDNNKFSSNHKIHRSFSTVAGKFDNVMVKWIPSDENTDAHDTCRKGIEDDSVGLKTSTT